MLKAQRNSSDHFGWKMEKWPGMDSGSGGSSNMEYLMISTTDEKGNISLTGGMMERQTPQQQITNYIDVKSVDKYSSKIEKLGEKVVHHKSPVPEMGYFAVAHDTENNSFGIWESNESAK
jgi:predicted enzyme related to lactoylglutathione lyase